MEWRRPIAKLESSELSGACNSFTRRPSLAGCGGFNGSAMPPTPTTTTTTIDDDRRRDDDDVDEHGAEVFEILDRVDAINLVQKSSKSELSSRFFGRSKFFGCKKVEFLNGRLPTEDGSVRPQTLGKRVSDDARHFIFRC